MFENLKEIKVIKELTEYEKESLKSFLQQGKKTFNFEDFMTALQILEDKGKVKVDWERLIHRLEVEKKI